MSREGALLVVVAIAVLLLVVLSVAWLRRRRRDAHWRTPVSAVPEAAVTIQEVPVLYVATTVHRQPLQRLAIPGLTYRAAGTLTVTTRGLGLTLAGSEPLFFAAEDIRATAQSPVAIDRVLERDGLVTVTWQLPSQDPVDSHFRPRTGSARALANTIRTATARTESDV